MGIALAVILGVSFGSISRLFTSDINVQRMVYTGLLVIVCLQSSSLLVFFLLSILI